MVDLVYLKDRVVDEINDANAYMRKAAEHRGTLCGEMFKKVAEQELNHANIFYDMFRQQEKPLTMSDKDYGMLLKEILDKFADGMSAFEAQKKIYWMT